MTADTVRRENERERETEGERGERERDRDRDRERNRKVKSEKGIKKIRNHAEVEHTSLFVDDSIGISGV